MNKRSISLYFVLFTAIINILVFTDFPKSHAKYIKTEEETISYETSIKKLKLSTGEGSEYTTKDNVSLLSSSVKDHAVFTVKFNRSNSMYIDSNGIYSDTLDTYRFIVKDNKNACYIKNNSISTLNGNITINNSKEFTVTYNNNLSDTVNLILECNVVDNPNIDNASDNIYVAFDVLESITNYNNNKEEEFTYIEFGYPLVLNDYFEAVNAWHPEEDDPIVYYKYNKAIEALNNKYSYLDDTTRGELVEYFDTVFKDAVEDDEAFMANINSLKGFTYDESLENPYVFSSNFAGNALTSIRYDKSVDKTKYNFYFSELSNLSIEDRKAIFDEYFDSYASSTLMESSNKDKIINYINSYIEDPENLLDGFEKMFEGVIFGISATTNNDILTLSFTDAILTLINNSELPQELFSENDTITLVNKAKNKDEMYTDFKTMLASIKMNNPELISDEMWNNFATYSSTNDPFWYHKIITLNSNEAENVTIYSYFYILENDNVLVNFYSDALNTYIKFTKLDHNIPVLLASSVGKTTYNKSFGDIINDIDVLLENGISITSWPSVYDTQVDGDSITHRYYVINGITYDFFTKDNISYVRYTTK